MYIKDGVLATNVIELNGIMYINPTHEQYLEAGYEVYVPPVTEPTEQDIRLQYESLVEVYIREVYSVSEEFSIHRQKEIKPNEWNNYYHYCEECKLRAKEELGLN